MIGHVIAIEKADNGKLVKLVHGKTSYSVLVNNIVVAESCNYYQAEDMFSNVFSRNRRDKKEGGR